MSASVWNPSVPAIIVDPALRTDLLLPTGTTRIRYIAKGAGAYNTLLDELLDREVNVWDYMSPALRADALSGAPVLDHAPAWNAAVLALDGAGRVVVPRKVTAQYLFKSTVNIGTSNVVDSAVWIDIDPGTLCKATMPNITDVVFSFKNVPGHFNNQGIRNLKMQSTNGNGVAMKFNGQCMGFFENNYIEGFNVGRWFSNEGNAVYNEFIRFNNLELHLCNTATLMTKDGDVGGTDTSLHGLCDRSVTVNVGVAQVGYQLIDVCWYNGDVDIKFFSQAGSEAIIKMSTSGTSFNKGVFVSGSITCEGPAKVIGTGRFYLNGKATLLDGVTDTLVAPDAWEQGLMSYNYIKSIAYGTSGMTVAELEDKSGQMGTTGPVGSFAQLKKANVQSLIANCYAAHATTPGNGFYTGYTGFHQNYDAGNLGCFLASDGTEYGTFAPTSTQCAIKHNAQFILRYDGVARANSTEGFYLGSGGIAIFSGTGSPEGVFTASVGSVYYRRDGAPGTFRYQKDTGSGNTGWIAKL